jgi:hypothetical protein
LFAPGEAGIVGPNGGATHAVNKIAAAITATARR